MICGCMSLSGPNREPLACGYEIGHEGDHSWATLPTFVRGSPPGRKAAILTIHLIDLPEVQQALDAAAAVAAAAMPYRAKDERVAAALDRLDRHVSAAVEK
jgi:hypothetical protein